YPSSPQTPTGPTLSLHAALPITFNTKRPPKPTAVRVTCTSTATKAWGSATLSATMTIRANPPANAGGPYSTCQTAAVNISGTATNQSSVLWTSSGTGTFGSASSLSTTYTPSAADVTAGSVTLTLTANATAPCTTNASSNA